MLTESVKMSWSLATMPVVVVALQS